MQLQINHEQVEYSACLFIKKYIYLNSKHLSIDHQIGKHPVVEAVGNCAS